MFERMLARLPRDDDRPADGPFPPPPGFDVDGVRELLTAHAGASFGGGAYRVHDGSRTRLWNALAFAAFADVAGAAWCFASDWLGRQHALLRTTPDGDPLVIILEVFTGQVLHTDLTFGEYHDGLLAEEPHRALELRLYDQWRRAGGETPSGSECVELVVPPFLGGEQTPANMGLTDMEVYWDLTGQLLRQVRDLPPDTPVGRVHIR